MLKRTVATGVFQGTFAGILLTGAMLTGCAESTKSYEDRNKADTGTPGMLNPRMIDGTDYISGYWDTVNELTEAHQAMGSTLTLHDTKLVAAGHDKAFLSWTQSSNETGADVQSIKIMQATAGADNVYSWSDPASHMFMPVGHTSTATDGQFSVNPVSGDGYAMWSDGGSIKLSEFMAGMGHFMGTATLGEGHAASILVDSAGTAYMLAQDHMPGGFGFLVSKRTAHNNWTTMTALHRMDMMNAYAMPNHFFKAMVDGQNNIVVVWLETQADATRLMTATLNTTDDTWTAEPIMILDNTNMNGVALDSLVSMAVTGVTGTDSIHIVLYQETETEKGIFVTGYMAEHGWHMAMRKDAQTETRKIASAPVYGRNGQGHLIAAWVEAEGMNQTVVALQYDATNGWGMPMDLETAAMNTMISELGLAVNMSGNALVTWVESDDTGVRVLAALQKHDAMWAVKELLAEYPAGTHVHKPTGFLNHGGTPSVAWNAEHMHEDMLSLSVNFVNRLANVENVMSKSDMPADHGHMDHTGHGM